MRHTTKQALLAGATIIRKGEEDDPAGIVTKALDEFKKSVDERLKAVEGKADTTALAGRLDALETAAARPDVDTTKPGEPTAEQKAYWSYLRHGEAGLAEADKKTLRVSSDVGGGYLAPAEMATEFLKDLVEFSPIRTIASVRQTGNPSVIYPVRIGRTNAKWKGENQPQESSEPGFGEAEIPVRELNTFVDISNQLLADSGGAAEREVRESLAEDFAQKEGAAFVDGDGDLQPKGFMSDSRVQFTLNGHATELKADALISILYALPAAYRRNASWVLNSTTLAAVRKLKDAQGNYLWQPGLQAGQPEMILGRPVVDAVDMPDVVGDAFPIAVGDFSAGYRIVDRLDMTVFVNPFSRANEGITRFHATRRTGAGVIRPQALRKLKMAAS